MIKRIKLGLVFRISEDWIGGTYYILNLVKALMRVPPEKQPILIILCKNIDEFNAVKNTGYPFLQYRNPYETKRNLFEKIVDKVFKIIFNKYIVDKRVSRKEIDVLFPASNEYVFERIEKKIFWFPDFQHLVYPSFFDANEIENRNNYLRSIANSNSRLVLSSNAAKQDWDKLPFIKNCLIEVIPFAVTHPPVDAVGINELRKEYGLEKDYFIVSNQFWAHKNHIVVLKAACRLHDEHKEIQFLLTGKQDDYRNPAYFKFIIDFIKENRLSDQVILTGLIDRAKQLKLMQHAKAVIQPSLFEGWSTVIEDAKSLGSTIIASDIPVHREQLAGQEAYFFNAADEDDLLKKIKPCLSSSPLKYSVGYKRNIERFGHSFIDLIEKAAR